MCWKKKIKKIKKKPLVIIKIANCFIVYNIKYKYIYNKFKF